MNYFRHLDHRRITMDFVVLKDIPSPYYDEIRQNGGTVFTMPSPANPAAYCTRIKTICRAGNYDILHCSVVNASIPYLYLAEKMGIRHRILHCHAARSAEVRWKEIRNDLLAPAALRNANVYFACSGLAGDRLFGTRPYTVIRNALDLNRFRPDVEVRQRLRTEMNLRSRFVLGTAGRLARQKNPYFALDVFREVLKKDNSAVYLWAGSGPLAGEVQSYAERIGVAEQVRFLGDRADISDLYQAMDVFFLPSLYEGLPVVGIEAQACSLPVVLSDTVTKEMKITENVTYLSLDAPKEIWAETLLGCRTAERSSSERQIRDSGYEISAEAEKLQALYLNMTEERGLL